MPRHKARRGPPAELMLSGSFGFVGIAPYYLCQAGMNVDFL